MAENKELLSDELVLALQRPKTSTRAKENIVKQYLMTQDQKLKLYEMGYTVNDLINKDVDRNDRANVMTEFYNPWNEKCGVIVFHFR